MTDAQLRFLPLDEVKRITSLPKSTIYELIGKGEFPTSIHVTPRRVAWLETEIHEWMITRIAVEGAMQ